MSDNTEKVIDKSIDLIEKIGGSASNIFDASKKVITDAIDQYGPQAIEAVLWVVRIDAIQVIVTSLFFVIVCVIIFNKCLKKFKESLLISYSEMPFIWGACMLCVAVFGFIKFQPLINVWNYVAVVKPEVYLVKQVVDVVKNKAALYKK